MRCNESDQKRYKLKGKANRETKKSWQNSVVACQSISYNHPKSNILPTATASVIYTSNRSIPLPTTGLPIVTYLADRKPVGPGTEALAMNPYSRIRGVYLVLQIGTHRTLTRPLHCIDKVTDMSCMHGIFYTPLRNANGRHH